MGIARVASLLLLVLPMLAACSTSPAPQNAGQSGASRVPRQTDRLCMEDCLGSGGNREFCEDRCTN